MHISKFVLEQGKVPLNPFMLFDYFLLDSLDRNLVREANNSIVRRADQLWVFGPVSNGVLTEIILAQKAHKPVLYFKLINSCAVIPIVHDEIEMEEEVEEYKSLLFSCADK